MARTVRRDRRIAPEPDAGGAPDNFRWDVPPKRSVMRVLHVPLAALTRLAPPKFARRSRLDVDPFDDFYRVNYPPVVRVAFLLCGSMAVAEELAQEAFVTAHRRWQHIAMFDRPDLWVRRVVINRAISHRRRLVAERRAVKRISERRVESPEPQLANDEVWVALRSLSGRQAQVLALVYAEDQPIAEVAAILELGEETIRTHLKRGRIALAAQLAMQAEDVTP